MKRLIKKSELAIQQGDFVDFGPYGKLYVCDADYTDEYFWVTKNEEERTNTKARGWSMDKDHAQSIIEEFDGNVTKTTETKYKKLKISLDEILDFVSGKNPSNVKISITDGEVYDFTLSEFVDIYELLDELEVQNPQSVVLTSGSETLKLV